MSISGTYKDSQEVAKLMEVNNQSFQAEEDGNSEVLASLLTEDFKIVRSNFSISDRQTMLDEVPANARRGRMVDEVGVTIYGTSAVVTSHLTIKNQDASSHFWNTKVFVKQDGEWLCRVWQVARLL